MSHRLIWELQGKEARGRKIEEVVVIVQAIGKMGLSKNVWLWKVREMDRYRFKILNGVMLCIKEIDGDDSKVRNSDVEKIFALENLVILLLCLSWFSEYHLPSMCVSKYDWFNYIFTINRLLCIRTQEMK